MKLLDQKLMMKLTAQKLMAIAIGVVVVIAIGVYLLIYGPLIHKLKAEHSICRDVELQALQMRNKIGSLKALDAKKGLIKEKDISFTINELTKKGKMIGVDFVSIKPGRIERKGIPYRILPIEIEIKSTYEELGMLLGSLVELERSVITARDFNITTDRESAVRLRASLTINVYLSK